MVNQGVDASDRYLAHLGLEVEDHKDHRGVRVPYGENIHDVAKLYRLVRYAPWTLDLGPWTSG